MAGLGKMLLVLGAGIAVLGVLLLVAARFGWTRLPGDIVVERKNFTFYAPLGLMVLLSLLLTLILNLFFRR